MNQKQKIIIGLISFLCGIPLIFLALKDNRQQKKKKKNLTVIKKNEKNENYQETSSSFLFWTVFIIIIVTLVIIFGIIIYKCRQKSEKLNNHAHNLTKDGEVLLTNLAKKTSFQSFFEPAGHIVLLNPQYYNNKINKNNIEKIFQKELKELENINSNNQFQQQVKKYEGYLKQILQKMINYLKTYLTGQLLYDVYQDSLINKNNYGILTKMANDMAENLYSDYIFLVYYDEDNKRKITENELLYIYQNQPLNLLRSVIRNDKITFMKTKKCYLFQSFTILYQFLDLFYNDGTKFFQDQIQKKNKKYETLFKNLQNDKQALEKLIFQKE